MSEEFRTAQSKDADRIAPIDQHWRAVGANKEDILRLLADLEERLLPVLGPKLPEEKVETKARLADSELSPLAKLTREHSLDLQSIGLRLRDLLKRIEL